MPGLQRSDAIRHADRLGAADGEHLERVVRAEARRIERLVLRDARRERGDAQRIERVGRVLRNRSRARCARRGDAARRGGRARRHALAEAEVRPWRVGDRSRRAQHDVALGVVEMHRVREQHVRTERAEPIEVHERTNTAAREIGDRVARRRRDVEGETGAAVHGRAPTRRPGARRDIRSWPTSVTHPSTRVVAAQRPIESRAGDRAPPRAAPRTGRRRRPNPTCRPRRASLRVRIAAATRSGCATVPASTMVVMPLVTCSTHDSVADSSSSSPVCCAWIGTAHVEDRLARCEIVGYRGADQPVAGEVLVRVDEARRDDGVARRRASRRRETAPAASAALSTATIVDRRRRRPHRRG